MMHKEGDSYEVPTSLVNEGRKKIGEGCASGKLENKRLVPSAVRDVGSTIALVERCLGYLPQWLNWQQTVPCVVPTY